MAASNINLAALVDQIPDTDLDIEALKKSENDKLGKESKFTAPDPAAAEAIFQQVLAGGSSAVRELISLIRHPGDPEFKSYKAEYLLHALANYAGRPEKEKEREIVIEGIVTQMGNKNIATPVRAFLVRELQLIGDAGAAHALGALLTDVDFCEDTATALEAIGLGAADILRAAMPNAKGKCRLAIVQSLGVLKDAKSMSELKKAAREDDPQIRVAAAWGLAQLGDASSTDILIKAADIAPGYDRNKATQACLLLAENLTGAGKKNEAAKIYRHLIETRTDPTEQYLRDIAQQALGTPATF